MTKTLLFDSVRAAQEVAYSLAGHWDQCNGVILVQVDQAALKLTTELLETGYCEMGKSCSQSESALYLLDDTSLLVASFAELSVTGRKASFQPELNDEDTSSNISASAQADFENYGHTDYFEVKFDNIFDYDLSDLLDFDEDQQNYLTTALQLEGYEEIALWVKVDIGKAKTVYKQLERELGGANEIAEIDWDG